MDLYMEGLCILRCWVLKEEKLSYIFYWRFGMENEFNERIMVFIWRCYDKIYYFCMVF